MAAQWQYMFFAKMKKFHIKNQDVAHQVGCSVQWVSYVLNGHRNPKNAEQRFNEALDKLIAEKVHK